MFGMENLPSGCVVVSYVVPDGSWMAMTLAPDTGLPVSVTAPAMLPLVTPCAHTGAIGAARAAMARTTTVSHRRMGILRA